MPHGALACSDPAQGTRYSQLRALEQGRSSWNTAAPARCWHRWSEPRLCSPWPDRSLFLEALETCREELPFLPLHSQTGQFDLLSVHVGVLLLVLLFIHVLSFIDGIRAAEPKCSRGRGEASGFAIQGANAARMKTRLGCVSLP